MSSFEVVNPATCRSVRSYPGHSTEQVQSILGQVDAAQREWSTTRFAERARHLRVAGEALRERAGELAERMAEEMGKPVSQGRSEAEKCAWVCDYYADHGESFLEPEDAETDATHSFVAYRPLGVVLAVMPWNFPFWQVFRFLAPALMAGNGGVLKHASNVPGCALAIEELIRRAGFPRHIFRTLLISSDQVAAVLEDDRVRAATLTGSTPAGRAVAAKAGEQLKKTVLELGGSDPYLILADADLAAAAAICAQSRLINSGQSCIAAKRFIVVESVRETFERLLLAEMSEAKMGDPMDEATDLGPQAREDLRDELHEQVERSLEAGARCLLGGEIPAGDGAFYPPTVLTDVARGMAAYEEELFGPVAAIIPVSDEEEAIRVANDSDFGLGAAVFTADTERGERIATERLEAGCCFVNDFVKSDPRLPFGGIKQSGYGRELARFGIREFVNTKTVYVR
ncbi:MAG: NAD-dependent succinate-semialdehyde dehydrogenase [Acidobacteriota bacterium]